MKRFWIVAAALAAASCAPSNTAYYRIDVSPELNYGPSYSLPPVEGACAKRARGELAGVLRNTGYEVALEGEAPEGAVTIRLEETACISELFGGGKFRLGLVLLLTGPDGSELARRSLTYAYARDKRDTSGAFKDTISRSPLKWEKPQRSGEDRAFEAARRDLAGFLVPKREQVRSIRVPECPVEFPEQGAEKSVVNATLRALAACVMEMEPGPARARVHRNVGMILLLWGNRAAALDAFDRATSEDPELLQDVHRIRSLVKKP